jgi:hypothetical protein
MPIDPRIAMGFQPTVQLESPLNRLAKFQQIESGQQQQQLNALRMQEAQAATEERNALKQLDPSSPDYGSILSKINPKLGIEHRTAEANRKKSELELNSARRKFNDDLRRNLSSNPSDENIKAWAQDAVIQNLYSPQEAEAQSAQLLALSPAERTRVLASSGASAAELMPKPAPKTDLAKLIEEQQNFQPGTPEYNLYQQAITKATTHTPGTQVNVGGAVLEKKEQQAKGELNVKGYEEVSNVARAATRTLPALETQEMLLNKGLETGFGAGAQKAGASILSALGVKGAEKFAANAESFNAAASQAVLTKQLEQKGPQTEADASRISRTGAELGNTVAGNRFIISVAKAQAKKDIQQRNFYDSWWKNNKTYEGVEDAWYAGEGGKSLFERPELKKYVEQPNTGVPLPSAGGARPSGAAPSSPLPKSPQGIDPAIWAVMTPEERALWKTGK